MSLDVALESVLGKREPIRYATIENWIHSKNQNKARNGKTVEKLKACWDYIDQHGKLRSKTKIVSNPTKASVFYAEKKREEDNGVEVLESGSMTFAQYAELYQATHVEPLMRNGKLVPRLRSHASRKSNLKHLVDYFGKRKLNTIKRKQIILYQNARLNTPLKNGESPKDSTVNRELEVLRRMLNQAHDILMKVPSLKGIISRKQENKRKRVIQPDEESRLLAACEIPDAQGRFKRLHVKPILICALDTAMRKGEILKLEWRDVDFDKNWITLRAEITKTNEERGVPISRRLRQELERMRDEQSPAATDKVFRRKICGRHAGKQITETYFVDVADNFQTSWEGIRKDAGVPDVVFHHTRHTAETRFIISGMREILVRKITGHKTGVFMDYFHPDDKELNAEFAIYETYAAGETITASAAVN